MVASTPGLSPDDLAQWARGEWPEPRFSLGWARLNVSQGAEEMIDCFLNRMPNPEAYKRIPGFRYGREVGNRYAWGGDVYQEVEKPLGVRVNRMLDFSARGCEAAAGDVGQFFPTVPNFWKRLDEMGCVAGRIDISIDFYGYDIDPIERAFDRDDVRGMGPAEKRDSRHSGLGGGRTLYFGGIKNGGSGIRWYEKGAQMKESFPILRFEFQAMGTDAADLYRALCRSAEPMAVARGLLTKSDFLEDLSAYRKTNHGSRAKRFSWWEELLAFAGNGVGYDRSDSREPTMESMIEWAKKSWPKALAKMQLGMGRGGLSDFLEKLLQSEAAVLDEFEREEVRLWGESRSPSFV